MSDAGTADDLFPPSPAGSTSQAEPAPIASTSRTPEPESVPQPASRSASRAREIRDPDEDDDDVGDLFGDDDDEEDKPASPRPRGRTSTGTPESRRSGSANPLEYAEEEGEGMETAQVVVNLPVPLLPRMSATDGKIWHLKLPAYVNLDSKPYDGDYYSEMQNGEEVIDGKEQPLLAKQKMLGVKNTIRWKWISDTDGKPTPTSNSRMVRWSDGSMSLQVGSDLFDIASSYGSTLARPEDIAANAALKPEPAPPSAVSSTTFLCTPLTHERVLLTEAAIAGQLSLVPTSSTSKTHIELVKHVGQQHVKHSRMKILDDTHDADKLKELLLKASGVDNPKPARPKTRRAGGSGQGRSSRSRRAASDDSDMDRGGASIRRSGPGDYEDDDGFIVADEDEDEAEETEDEEEADWGSSKKSKSKSKKRKGSDDDALDEMEEAERRIEQREREKKRAKRESKKKSRDYVDTDEDEDAEGEPDDGEADMDMDVESEDD